MPGRSVCGDRASPPGAEILIYNGKVACTEAGKLLIDVLHHLDRGSDRRLHYRTQCRISLGNLGSGLCNSVVYALF